MVHQIPQHTASESANASLQNHQIRCIYAFFLELFHSFFRQCGIALHDISRDFFIAFPSRILHHSPTIFFGSFVSHADGIVIKIVCYQNFCGTYITDCLHTAFHSAFGHINISLTAEFLRRPSNTFAMIAIGSSDEHHIFDLFLIFFGTNLGKVRFFQIHPQFFANDFGNGINAAQSFECIEPKAVGFILHKKIPQSQFLCPCRQFRKRCHCVTGYGTMKCRDFFHNFLCQKSRRNSLPFFCFYDANAIFRPCDLPFQNHSSFFTALTPL